jgi:preprotein translocase subunit SecE
MARNTRQQRRARRREAAAQPAEQQQKQQTQGVGQRARARQQQVRPAAPPKQQTGRREPRERGRFVKESWAELKKVEWPGRNQVLTGSVVVIIACAIVGAYLWVADLALQRLVERVLL